MEYFVAVNSNGSIQAAIQAAFCRLLRKKRRYGRISCSVRSCVPCITAPGQVARARRLSTRATSLRTTTDGDDNCQRLFDRLAVEYGCF